MEHVPQADAVALFLAGSRFGHTQEQRAEHNDAKEEHRQRHERAGNAHLADEPARADRPEQERTERKGHRQQAAHQPLALRIPAQAYGGGDKVHDADAEPGHHPVAEVEADHGVDARRPQQPDAQQRAADLHRTGGPEPEKLSPGEHAE